MLSWTDREILTYGKRINKIWLAGVVMDLYDAAIQDSTRNQYKTGQRDYVRFATFVNVHGLFPFPRRSLNKTELT